MKPERVVVLGASHKPERYSNMAIRALRAHGHTVIPVNPAQKVIEGIEVVPRLENISGDVNTLTMYVNPSVGESYRDAILKLAPKRVIFNPGTESAALENALSSAGISVLEGCTLVMLRSNTF